MNENQLTIVKEYDFNKPGIHEIDYLLEDIIKDCRNRYFHTFKFKLVFEINFTNISNNEEVNFTITPRSMEFKTEFYGLVKKTRNSQRTGLIYNQRNNFERKIFITLFEKNIHSYLKLQIRLMHRHFFKIISQNPDYNQTLCKNLVNLFHFACRKWFLYNNPQCWFKKSYNYTYSNRNNKIVFNILVWILFLLRYSTGLAVFFKNVHVNFSKKLNNYIQYSTKFTSIFIWS